MAAVAYPDGALVTMTMAELREERRQAALEAVRLYASEQEQRSSGNRLSAAELGKRQGWSRATTGRRMNEGMPVASRNPLRFDPDAVDAWLADRIRAEAAE